MLVLEHEFTNSSNIKKVEYDEFLNVLVVTFYDEKTYSFVGVEKGIYDDFIIAESPGKYFHANIRGKFEHMKNAPDFKPSK